MKQNEKIDWGFFLIIFLHALAATVVLVAMAGCRTVYVPTPEYHEVHDTIVKKEIVEKEVVKEKVVRDSVSFQVKGDTVYISKFRYERDYRYEKALQEKIDSLSHVKADSIPYPVPVEVAVPADIKKWQRGLMWIGATSILLAILYIFMKLKFAFHK